MRLSIKKARTDSVSMWLQKYLDTTNILQYPEEEFARFDFWFADLSFHRCSPKMGPPDHLWQIMLLWMVPRTKYGCHRWSPRIICGTVSGPPLPQMVPLKLSLEMMSRGSYEVNLANMDRVIIIIIYFSLCIASCSG